MDAALVLGVVRGERDFKDLETLGVKIAISAVECRIEGGGAAVVAPSARDFALGLLRKCTAFDARDWARVILAASALIDVQAIEDGEQSFVLEALWDLADPSARALSDDTLRALRNLTSSESRRSASEP